MGRETKANKVRSVVLIFKKRSGVGARSGSEAPKDNMDCEASLL